MTKTTTPYHNAVFILIQFCSVNELVFPFYKFAVFCHASICFDCFLLTNLPIPPDSHETRRPGTIWACSIELAVTTTLRIRFSIELQVKSVWRSFKQFFADFEMYCCCNLAPGSFSGLQSRLLRGYLAEELRLVTARGGSTRARGATSCHA